MKTKYSHEKTTVMEERVITKKKEPGVEWLCKKHTETNKVISPKYIAQKKKSYIKN